MFGRRVRRPYGDTQGTPTSHRGDTHLLGTGTDVRGQAPSHFGDRHRREVTSIPIERLATLPLLYEPGFRWHYSVAVDVTGLVVERISGMSFDEFLRTRIFEPLDMHDTFFGVG